jgi:uncharacterized membrane protein YfcA
LLPADRRSIVGRGPRTAPLACPRRRAAPRDAMSEGGAFYALAAAAVLLTGVSKGGFGGSLGGIAVPLMALAIPAPRAAAIMVPLLCLTDVIGFRAYAGRWDRSRLRVMIPGGLAGIVVGALTVRLLTDDFVRLLVGGIAVGFPLHRWLAAPAATRAAPPAPPSPAKGVLWSGLSGYASFLAHAGGPPILVWMLPQRLDKVTYVATLNFFFMVMNASKILPYALLGQLSRTNLLTSVALAPLVPLGVWIGVTLNRRVNEATFYRAVQVFMLLTGLQLIWRSAAPHLPRVLDALATALG